MDKKMDYISILVTTIFVLVAFFGNVTYKKIDDTQKEWKKIVVKQGEYIKKLAEHNKDQDVIINKLNAEYNLKGKKHE